MAPQKQIVFPGDPVAIAEEFLSGPGTYEENGNVYAARLGELVLDTNEFQARVTPLTKEPATLKPGDVVIGTVQGVRSSMAIVEVRAIASQPDRQVAGDTNGTLHIGKVADYYVESMENAFRLGDIIRAEVTSASPSVQLTTKSGKFGVLKSFCPRCRTAMNAAGRALVCPECEWKETGKLAADYGVGNLIYEGPEPEPERAERREGGGRGGPRGGMRSAGGDRRGGGREGRGGYGDRRGGGREGRGDRGARRSGGGGRGYGGGRREGGRGRRD